ncbi:hypothetical protein Q7C36_009146 [Tachysurus vachellii]|uniref:Uncharacterized protein n=1 Tax=Tachysurus vachellii TaxID=175792 RepID=A0AA88N5E6_TACVA|nr:hypothetical protein Q7C36_009146 [Tachysurus vachellii]
MGNKICRKNEPFFCFLLSVAESSDIMPNIGIDDSLLKYSGLNSAAELDNSVKQTLMDMGRRSPDFLGSLGSDLAAFDAVPNAVGLGALVLSLVLEFTIRALDKQEKEDSTFDVVRRVFAEEKASGVRDSMEEYLKRLAMYLHQPTEMLEETNRLEKQLSEQLTCLKNSMLHDKKMSSRSMKHWTNGAAFHLQMLIHAARRKLQNTTKDEEKLKVHVASIITVLNRYQYDLQELLKLYKIYKNSTIKLFYKPSSYMMEVVAGYAWVIKDNELRKQTVVYCGEEMVGTSDAYIDYMFDHWSLIKQLNRYFDELKDNLQELITQNFEFNMQKVLPVSDNHSAL